jgi:hypothetical protein
MMTRTITLKTKLCAALAALLWVGSVLPARAQADGRFSGTARDTTGASVAGVAVTVQNQRTGEERSTISNDQGRYLITNLRPSTYTIRAIYKDFAPLAFTDLRLVAAQEFALDLELRPAGVTEAVTVQGSSQVIDLSSAKMGVNVGDREVQALPVNGRQMSQFLLQAPGSQNTGAGTWYDIRFSGQPVEHNAYRFDGIDGGAVISAVPGNVGGEISSAFKLQASIENVQEFRVESSAYPAEFGTGAGGQVSVVTKSGSNRVSGGLFEYVRNEKFDAPNYFDTYANLPKSLLRLNQFGGSVGGPLAKNKAFFFGSYEGYRLKAGVNLVEAVPSAASWARAVPAIAALRPGFLAPGAVILDGKSTNPGFDIAQFQSPDELREDAFSGRLDVKFTDQWSSFVRVFHDQGTSDAAQSVSGRFVHTTDNPTNFVFNLLGVLGNTTTNEFKIGYNAAPTRLRGLSQNVNGVDFTPLFISLSGNVINAGVPGQGSTTGIAAPGGLIRLNSAQNGRESPYDPYALSFIDSINMVRGNHLIKAGGEYRMIRITTDRLGGTSYAFDNLNAFLANNPSSITYIGDESAPSVFNNGATGARHLQRWYGIGYLQDEWHANPKFTLNYGLRYDYYSLITEANNLEVKFNTETGKIDPNTTPSYKPLKTMLQPRIGGTYLLGDHTALRGGFGLFVGPGITEGVIQAVADSDYILTRLTNTPYPLNTDVAVANFINNPNNRQYAPRGMDNDYSLPEQFWQYSASLQQDLGANTVATIGYIGSQGRNLFLRSATNLITDVFTNPDPTKAAIIVRQFSNVTARNAAGIPTAVQNPYAEIDTRTSGGYSSYHSLQLGMSRRMSHGLAINGQYTLGRSKGTSSGSKEADAAGNLARTPAQYEYEYGYNKFDLRHSFNLTALYDIPYKGSGVAGGVLGGWTLGGIWNTRTGFPVNVLITRPDVVYRDAAGNIFNNPADGRTAIINTPGGGASRNVRRPDLIPGVDPYIQSGGLLFLNAAAFATPAPGTNGNLERGLVHGPGYKQVDLVASKRVRLGGSTNIDLRVEVFNVFDWANFSNPVGTLPNALPTTSLSETNKVQPGQPYTPAAAGAFGTLTSTVAKTVGMGSNRQVQFAVRLNF